MAERDPYMLADVESRAIVADYCQQLMGIIEAHLRGKNGLTGEQLYRFEGEFVALRNAMRDLTGQTFRPREDADP